jgi:hypothetical protein
LILGWKQRHGPRCDRADGVCLCISQPQVSVGTAPTHYLDAFVCFCSPIMSSQAKDEEVNKITEDAFGNTTPVLTTHQRNVKVGTLEDASDPNNQQNTKDG